MTQPDSIPAEWIQKCGGKLSELCAVCNDREFPQPFPCDRCTASIDGCLNLASAAITILRPLIEAQTRERCAHACEELGRNAYEGTKAVRHYMACAAMIRELPA